MGDQVGVLDGPRVGELVGPDVVGTVDGLGEGRKVSVGLAVGDKLGKLLGNCEGASLGCGVPDGRALGEGDGRMVSVGDTVGRKLRVGPNV